ncbi:MAG: hypothetical protein ACRDMV_24300 [Streptosporangiales bacterium]
MRSTSARELVECLECGRAWDHCHGTLVVHVDGSAECSDLACVAVEDAHTYTLACVELLGGCSCG